MILKASNIRQIPTPKSAISSRVFFSPDVNNTALCYVRNADHPVFSHTQTDRRVIFALLDLNLAKTSPFSNNATSGEVA